jgi:hypothetical protein
MKTSLDAAAREAASSSTAPPSYNWVYVSLAGVAAYYAYSYFTKGK